jgi:hypothetical protein
MYAERMSEALSIVSVLVPVSQGAATVTSTSIDMKLYRRVMFILQAGVLGASATLDMAIKGDTASGGSYTTTITGKSITQLVKATDDNKQAIIEVTAEEVAAQGFRYIRASVTVGVAASLIALVALADNQRYRPAGDFDLTSVAQIVAD